MTIMYSSLLELNLLGLLVLMSVMFTTAFSNGHHSHHYGREEEEQLREQEPSQLP